MPPEQFGSYLVGEQLGTGGMASVYLAESRSAGGFRKRVALKRLLPGVMEDPELVASFVEEAKLACYLTHANIAKILDFGKIDGVYYIAFAFVAGPTLAQLQRQANSCVGAIPIPVVLNIASQMCEALGYAHDLKDEKGKHLGIVHRDVSPPNVILANNGLVKLIDFGLAKAKRSSVHTQAGIIKGKLSYVAPEYIGGKLDLRCDLWAVGVVVHELLTGRRLFDARNDLATLERVRMMHVRAPSRTNPDVPHDLDDIVMTALQRDPARRWQSAAAMRTALDGVANQLQRVTNAQMIDWVEWAFMQQAKPHENSVSMLLSILERPSAAQIDDEPIDEPSKSHPAITKAMLERRRTPPAGSPALPSYNGGLRLGWLVVLFVLAAGVTAALTMYGLPEW